MKHCFCAVALILMTGGCDGGGGSDDTSTDDGEDAADTATDTEDDAEAPECTGDDDCDNGVFCDGVEQCTGGACVDGDNPCDDSDPCTADTCDDDLDDCDNADLDADDDGYVAAEGPGGEDCGGDDCDDSDDGINPGITAGCSSTEDLDCNGEVDEDNDGDGHVDLDCSGDDCDDSDPLTYPGAEPACVGDHDCNGFDDNDNDDDGYDSTECPDGTDCIDTDPLSFPRDAEGGYGCLDGIDNNCDTIVDNAVKMLATDVHAAYGATAASNGTLPSILWTGSEYSVVYQSTWGSPVAYPNVMHYTFSPMGAPTFHGNESPLTNDMNNDRAVAISWTGTGYGLAWYREEVAGAGDDRIAFMNADADWYQGSPVILTSTDSVEDPAIAWNGSRFGVCWRQNRGATESRDIVCNVVDNDGTAMGSDVVVGDSGWQVEDERCWLTWNGSVFALTWSSTDPSDAQPDEVLFRLLDADMTPLASAVTISNATTNTTLFPRIAWAHSQFAVTWSETTDYSWGDQFIRFVNDDGTLPGSIVQVNAPGGLSFFGSVAWTGSALAVSWSKSVDVTNLEIFTRLFDADGVPLSSETRFSEAPGYSQLPMMAWSGTEMGITWQDERDSAGTFKIYMNRLGFCD